MSEQEKDKGFQDKLMALLEWVAEHDPLTAARLVGDFTEDLARELSVAVNPIPES